MKKIHMDVEEVREVKNNLLKLSESIQYIVQSTNGTIDSLPVHWRSPATDEFMGEYADSLSKISGILGPLGDMAAGLEEAIAEWERAAARLSD